MNTSTAVCLNVAMLLLLTACSDSSSEPATPSKNMGNVAPVMRAEIMVTKLNNPSVPGARLPNLSGDANGAILSWIETNTINDEPLHHLRFAEYYNAQWSSVKTIVSGNNWFINWADFPSVYRNKTSMAAHWLQRSSSGTYSYDVMTRGSHNGRDWTESVSPHRDGTPTEHGFASFFTQNGHAALVWLDGRNTKADGGHDNHAGGAMTLRTAVLSESTDSDTSVELDLQVCDCCQTSAVNTANGPVVFYRDRSDDEIRDISYVRLVDQSWSKPVVLHNDGWNITGCPVNGPQADAIGQAVAVAWFTGAANKAKVKVAFSTNNGESFSAPSIVSDASPLGRVDVVMLTPDLTAVSWMEEIGNGQAQIKLRLFSQQRADGEPNNLALVSASRQTGFVRMARLSDHSLLAAWTRIDDEQMSIDTAIVKYEVQ